MADFLLKHGANINQGDSDRWTALTHAAGEGNSLIVVRIEWNKVNMFLTSIGKVKITDFLIKHGADLGITTKSGHTALDIATERGNLSRHSTIQLFKFAKIL